MRFRLISVLVVLGSVGLIYGVTQHKLTLSPHRFGDDLGISLIALVGLCALMGAILGAGDKK